MAEVMQWLDRERVAIIVESGPLILLGIAWLALQPRRGNGTLSRHEEAEGWMLKGRKAHQAPEASGRPR